MTEETKRLKKIISEVNKSIVWYKRGGWVDARRTPDGSENFVENLREYVEARFNRECFDIPELQDIFDLLGGEVWEATLEEPDEDKKKYKMATLTLVDPNVRRYVRSDDPGQYLPTEEVEEMIEKVKRYFGGNRIKFNSVKVKIKYFIEND